MKNFDKLAELAQALPADVKANALALVARMGEVIEGLSDKPQEWRPPTLKLVQATTDRSKLPKGATIGSLILGETVLTTPFRAIPMRVATTRQMWNPDPAAATMVCSSPDGEVGFRYGNCKACPNSKFDEVEKRSACNKTINIISVAADLSNIFYTNFSKTNYSNGLDWQSLMKKAGVSPFKRMYEISSGTSPKVKNVEVIKVEPVAGDNAVNPKHLAFIEELFRIASEDRKASIANFYDYLENKKDASSLVLEDSSSQNDVVLITASEGVTADATAASTGGYTL
jgi:hypothetical protein